MSAPLRIKGVPRVPRGLDPELSKQLQAHREAIEQLNGDGLLAAVRQADFLDLLRSNIGNVNIPPSSVPVPVVGVNQDKFFQDLKRQFELAREDLDALLKGNAAADLIARDARDSADQLAQDAQQAAQDLSDLADELAAEQAALLDLATQVTSIQTEVDDPTTGLLALSTLITATASRVDATEDSIDILTASVTSLESELIDTAALDPGIMWQFEADDDGWTSNATLTTHSYYITVGSGSGTYFRSPSGIATDGRLYTRIVARIRRVSGTGWLGRATYSITAGHSFDATNYHLTIATEPTFAGGGWVIVTWDMELLTAGGTDWVDHVIDQIQLELSDDGSTVFEVDWVAIGRIAPSYTNAVVSSFESRITAAEGAITSLNSAVTSLTSTVSGLSGDVSTNTTAISGLTTRVTTAEGNITSLSTSVTSLNSRMTTAEGNITTNSSAISGLSTSVTSLNGQVSTNTSSITSLTSRMGAAESTDATLTTGLTNLTTVIGVINGTLTTQSSNITSLTSRMTTAEGNITSQGSALTALTTRVTTAEGNISTNTTAITNLNASLTTLNSTVSGQASALTTLTAQVSSVQGQVTSLSSSVTTLQASIGSDSSNRLNPLTVPNNASGWPIGIGNTDVMSFGTFGARTGVGARVRTSSSAQVVSQLYDIHPRGIYEVRLSALKTVQHGYMYFGLYSSADGSTFNGTCQAVLNRAVQGGFNNNNYWTYGGAQNTNHVNSWVANIWYDFVFYILGSDADITLCPQARVNDQAIQTFDQNKWFWAADGYRMASGCNYVAIRFLNYYNAVQTDMWVTAASMKRTDNQRTAAIVEEATIRANADGTISAEKTIKIDVNGYVAGYGLIVSGGASGPITSSFTVLADRFNIALPGVSGPIQVFTVGNINGTPTVGINGNLIVDGTVVARAIGNGALGQHNWRSGTITSSNFSVSGAMVAPSGTTGVMVNFASHVEINWSTPNVGSLIMPNVQVQLRYRVAGVIQSGLTKTYNIGPMWQGANSSVNFWGIQIDISDNVGIAISGGQQLLIEWFVVGYSATGFGFNVSGSSGSCWSAAANFYAAPMAGPA